MNANPRHLNPQTLSKPNGYSHVVEVTGPGRMIYVAGQVPFDRDGKVVGAGDFEKQAVQVFENLKAALHEVGATFDSVVKVNNYLTDLKYRPILREVRDRYLNKGRPPASTLVGVTALADPQIMIEVEVVAFLPAR